MLWKIVWFPTRLKNHLHACPHVGGNPTKQTNKQAGKQAGKQATCDEGR